MNHDLTRNVALKRAVGIDDEGDSTTMAKNEYSTDICIQARLVGVFCSNSGVAGDMVMMLPVKLGMVHTLCSSPADHVMYHKSLDEIRSKIWGRRSTDQLSPYAAAPQIFRQNPICHQLMPLCAV